MPANVSTDLLVITCASGKQVSTLLPLLSDWKHIRLVVKTESSQGRLSKVHPHAEVVVADLAIPIDCTQVLKDATCVYHIGPSFHPHEDAIGQNMIDAALQVKDFKHFIYSSVLNSQLRKLMNHDVKRYVEEYLMESGLEYTILQPTHFMDMFPLAKLKEAKGDEVTYPANWNPEVEFSFVSLKDLAEAAQIVIQQREKHFGAAYNIVGTEKLSYNKACEIAGSVLGKKVVVKQKSFEEAVGGFEAMMFGGNVDIRVKDELERMLLYYNRHGLVGN
jgi:uncharacterized protein YbjT (DUF2867 family)